MAEREIIIVDPARQALEQTAKEMREYEKNPIDRSAKPGGYFLNADGSGAHDSEGNPVPLLPKDKDHAEELRLMTKARFSNQALETVALDSPEEVAERLAATPQAPMGQPWTPPAVAKGTVLPDGSVSDPTPSSTKKK